MLPLTKAPTQQDWKLISEQQTDVHKETGRQGGGVAQAVRLGLRTGGSARGRATVVCSPQAEGHWESFPLNSWGRMTVPFPVEVAVRSRVCRLQRWMRTPGEV